MARFNGHLTARALTNPSAPIAVAKDGSLLIADDTAGTIWRVAYAGKSKRTTAR